jgi:RNA polymerase sigma factor (sigma-70 family)
MAPLLSAPLLRTQSDRRLAALAADGHDRAFEAIVERYGRPLQRYLRRLLSEALAEDVLQASFVRAWQALRAGTDVRDLRSWLYRIAHNQALNTLRAAGEALAPVSAEIPAVSLEAEVERREELRQTLHGIEALPDRQRAALVAVAVADRPHADVARELGMSDGALRQQLLRARTTLRAAATALTPYPLMSWLAGGQEVTATRVAEVAVGAGGAGVAIKASAAVLAAGAVVAGGPALRDGHAPARAQAEQAAETAQRQAAPRGAATVINPAPTPDHEAGDQSGAPDHGGRPAAASQSSSDHGGSGKSGSGESGSGESGSDDGDSGGSGSGTSGSGSSGETGSGHGSRGSDDGGSGHGSSGSGSSGSGSGGSGSGAEDGGSGSSGSGSGSSGSGSGEGGSGQRGSGERGDAIAPAVQTPTLAPGADAPLPAVTPAPSDSGSSGSGSGSSGSDSSGSGSSGSGSSGPG